MTTDIVSSDFPPHWHHRHYVTLSTTMEQLDLATLDEGEVQLVTADTQTAGRGQRGTTWESQHALNLTFSFAFCPQGLEVGQQFLLSEVVALAVARTLSAYTDGISVKWPNDVYYGSHKICGMLLEHRIVGRNIAATLVGVGINVNQIYFRGDAPNPISLCRIVGREVERSVVLKNFVAHFETLLHTLYAGGALCIEEEYFRSLYRREGMHPYQDVASGQIFSARILRVAPTGLLTLGLADGTKREYAFKAVSFVR